VEVRKKYELYNDKICTDQEAAENKISLAASVAAAGYMIVTDVGDVKQMSEG
jgi:biotin synthase